MPSGWRLGSVIIAWMGSLRQGAGAHGKKIGAGQGVNNPVVHAAQGRVFWLYRHVPPHRQGEDSLRVESACMGLVACPMGIWKKTAAAGAYAPARCGMPGMGGPFLM